MNNLNEIYVATKDKEYVLSKIEVNQERNRYGTQIIFIYGKGSGALRRELIAELEKRRAMCTHEEHLIAPTRYKEQLKWQ